MINFIKIRVDRVLTAIKGMFILIFSEAAIKAQLFFITLFIFLGIYFEISLNEWIIQIFLMGFVLSIESLNTSVEKICDFVHPDFNKKIGFIKDIAAGAVFFAAVFAIFVIYNIYWDKLL